MEFIEGSRQILWMLLAGVVLQVIADEHYIDPTVRLVSCLTGKIVLKITDSQTDGVMYIKDEDTAYNMQFTENGTMVYSCGFVECNLSWNTPFKFVIQRKVEYQTIHDVKLIFTCIWDQSDIVPYDNANNNLESRNTQFYIYTATASMSFYNNDGGQIFTGSYIKLGTDVTMEIKLVNTHDGLLDINVKSCEAAGIGIINDRCPLDESLFDSFNKTSVGVVENLFQMFRTTSSNPEPISMVFSCLLEVCYAPCIKYDCNGTFAIPGTRRLKRRETQEPGQVAKSMTVGSLFKVGIGDPVFVNKETPNNCVAVHVFVATVAVFGFLLFLSLSAMLYYWQEWKKIKEALSAKCEAAKHVHECLKDGLASPAVNKIDHKGIKVQTEKKVNGTESSQVNGDIFKCNALSVTMGTKTKDVVKSCFINTANSSWGKSFDLVKDVKSNITTHHKVIIHPDQSVGLHNVKSSNSELNKLTNSGKVKDKKSLLSQGLGKNLNLMPKTKAKGTSVLSPDVGTYTTKPIVLQPKKKVSFIIDDDPSVSSLIVGACKQH